MTAIAVEFQPVTIETVRRLAKLEGACVSIYLPAYQQGSAAARSDVLLRSFTNLAEEQLRTRGLSPTDVVELLEPLWAFHSSDERLQRGHSTSLAIFRSANFFEVYALPEEVEGKVYVEASFQVLPLLEFTSTPHNFYLLALTRKGVRLIHNGQEVPLPATVPATLEAFLALDVPDHRLDNRSSSGPSTGKMKRLPFGTGTELEDSNKRFRDYCVAIDRGLTAMFEPLQRPPLVLAGAVSETSIYRRVNTYTRLAEEVIVRSPDDGVLTDAELTERAARILAENPSPAEIRANAHVFGALGSSRVVTELNALVRAASRGKVGEVFIAAGLSAMGDVDHITGKVRVSGEIVANEDDLYNAAAVETLKHSGEVFVVPPERIPGGFGAVAALRYS